jgi:hypothetical protein
LSDCLCNNQIIWFLPTWNIFVYTRPFSFLKKGIIITWLGHWNSDNKISAFFLPTFTCPRKEKKKYYHGLWRIFIIIRIFLQTFILLFDFLFGGGQLLIWPVPWDPNLWVIGIVPITG